MIVKLDAYYVAFAQYFDVVVVQCPFLAVEGVAVTGRVLEQGKEYWLFPRTAQGWQDMLDLFDRWRKRTSYRKYKPLEEMPARVRLVADGESLSQWAKHGSGVRVNISDYAPAKLVQRLPDFELPPPPTDIDWKDFRHHRAGLFFQLRPQDGKGDEDCGKGLDGKWNGDNDDESWRGGNAA